MAAMWPSKVTHVRVPDQPSMLQRVPSKSHSNFLCKSILVVLVLIVIPLLPSQAPDFIRDSIINEVWEIFHLLLIGIAVSYGLLSRKTSQVVPGKTVHDESVENLSGISHLASVFENGFECFGDSDDEKRLMQSYFHNQCLQSNDGKFIGKQRREIDETIKNRSLPEGRANRPWLSQYCKTESLVVVARDNYVLDEFSDYKPLNLPVRSLKSTIVDNGKPESEEEKQCSLEFQSCKQMDPRPVHVQKIRGLVPINLEKKFDEVSGASPIPWRSRSGRTDMDGESTHFIPQPLGKSKSLRDSTSCSSCEGVEYAASKKDIARTSEAIRFRTSETFTKNCAQNGKEDDSLRQDTLAVSSSESDIESSDLAKLCPRAKSVRTIKPNRYLLKENDPFSSQIEGDWKGKNLKGHPVGHRIQDYDSSFTVTKQKMKFSDFYVEEREDMDCRNAGGPKEGSQSAFDGNSEVEDSGAKHGNDAELDGSDVDRKAGEFIAKFREQIGLQKLSPASGDHGC